VTISSLIQNTLINGSSSHDVADDDALTSGPSNPHVANDLSPILATPDSSTPLLNDEYKDTLHDSPTPITLHLDWSRPILKWSISTLVNATKFLVGPSMCYQEKFPPP
jgi:hypothetical protein